MDVQLDVPVGHWKSRLSRLGKRPRGRRLKRSYGVVGCSLCRRNGGCGSSGMDEFPFFSSSSLRRRSMSSILLLSNCPIERPSCSPNCQYSKKNISLSSSLILRTPTGRVSTNFLCISSFRRTSISSSLGYLARGGLRAYRASRVPS